MSIATRAGPVTRPAMSPEPDRSRPQPQDPTLRVRWLGRVDYRDAHALQHGFHSSSPDDHLLLLEHPHVFTLGIRADPTHVLVDPESVGADLVRTDRGGDVTYHGPGQLVGYPVLSVPGRGSNGMADTVAYVRCVEQVIIDALALLGVTAGRLRRHPGVWVDPDGAAPRKIAAIGVRLTRGRSMHGFALNVDPDLSYFDHIVPCGIADKDVTSIAAEGAEADMSTVVDAIVERAVAQWAPGGRWERAEVVWRNRRTDLSAFSRGYGPGRPAGPGEQGGQGTSVRLAGRMAEAGVTGGLRVAERKPPWLRAKVRMGEEFLDLKSTMRTLDLRTVCEEAGCPNIFECWADGTATFMIGGERCTRACGFCLVDTGRPEPVDPDEPERVAEAVAEMGLRFAVLTAVARDDLPDGGAAGFVACIHAIRRRSPGTSVEVLIPDFRGSPDALGAVCEARPDVFNHNLETVARLQRAVRPSAGYARSLSVLARGKAAGLVTKSGLIVGLGETLDEVAAALADLRAVGVDIVTVGQYLRPTTNHLPVARWWAPGEFERLKTIGERLGIAHVAASPLTRSSYHARQAADAAASRT